MKKLIIANWKLNPTKLKDAVRLASAIQKTKKNTVVLCPPHIYLSQVKYPLLGAQDCFWMDKGAFTGQVSALQVKDLKAKYCIVGHSERRAVGDTDEVVHFKLKAALGAKLIPVLCVGFGTAVNQDDLEAVDILRQQLDFAFRDLDAKKVIVAYEPVWAIGTGKNASPEHAEKISLYIKNRYGVAKVLYGGSVSPANAREFLEQRNVDGLLVGGASLIPSYFNEIINM